MGYKFSLLAHWIIFFMILLFIALQIQKPTPAKRRDVDLAIEQYWDANLCTVYTSLIYSEDYLPGVLVLFKSLREHHSFLSCDKFEVLISEHVSQEILTANHIEYTLVETIIKKDIQEKLQYVPRRLWEVNTKLYMFMLGHHIVSHNPLPYSMKLSEKETTRRVLYMEADSIVLRRIEAIEHCFNGVELCAFRDPDRHEPYFTSVAVYIHPSPERFKDLIDSLESPEFHGEGTHYLNKYWKDKHLAFVYLSEAFEHSSPDKVSVLDTTEVYHFKGNMKPWYWYNFLFIPTVQLWHDVAKRCIGAYANAVFWEYIALLYGAIILAISFFFSWEPKKAKNQKITKLQRIIKTIFVECFVGIVVLIVVMLMPLNMFPHTATFLLYWFAEWTVILGLWIFSKVVGISIRVDGIQIMQIFAPFIGIVPVWLFIENYGVFWTQVNRITLYIVVTTVTSTISCISVYFT